MNETDFAYTAGYIDGDGCFYIGEIKTSPFFQDTFSIISTHLDNIEWFKSKFEGSINVKPSRTKNRLTSYHFVFKKKGYHALDKIFPYLIEKKQEFELFKQFKNPLFKDDRKSLVKSMYILKNNSNLIPCSIKKEVEDIRNTISPSITDFAYLAGFIDAECSLDISRSMQKNGVNPCYRIQIQCNNSKAPIFYWLASRFGGQFHFLNKSHIKNCRNQMLWRVSSKQLYFILKSVQPFLIHKKPNCDEMIKFQELTSHKGRTSPNFSQREEIYYKVRHLNKSIII